MSLILDEPIVTTDEVTEILIVGIFEELTQGALALHIKEIRNAAEIKTSAVVKRIPSNLYEGFKEKTKSFQTDWLNALARKAGWETEQVAEYFVDLEKNSVVIVSTSLKAYVLDSSELEEVLQDVSSKAGINVYTAVKDSAYSALELNGEVI